MDVGAGLRKFASDGIKQDLDIYSLEPRFQDSQRFFSDADREEIERILRELTDEQKKTLDAKTIAGTIENSDIPDESFDLIVANKSIPFYSENTEHIRTFFRECLRILRPGGELRVNPCVQLRDGSISLTIADQLHKGITDKEVKDIISEIQSTEGVSIRIEGRKTLIVSKEKKN